MNSSSPEEGLPPPPGGLTFGAVTLNFIGVMAGDPAKGYVPYYHFRIQAGGRGDVGHINFRVGDSDHVRLCAGHVGFGIDKTHRGHRYALQACRALAPFVRSFYEEVTLTCNPDNVPSRRTIERLGAHFLDEVDVAPHEPAYHRGARRKRRYLWRP